MTLNAASRDFHNLLAVSIFSQSSRCLDIFTIFSLSRYFHNLLAVSRFSQSSRCLDIFTIFSLSRYFHNLLGALRPVSYIYVQVPEGTIACNVSSAYPVQHAGCHMVRRDSSVVKFDRVEIAFSFISIAETIRRCRSGGERSTLKKLPTTSFTKCHMLQPENSSPNSDSNPHCIIGSRWLPESSRANHYITCCL